MSDIYSKEKRSELMSKVRSKNTNPEMKVRSWLHQRGFRYRIHRKDLPGHPDIVLRKHNTVIFVHGCFWHQHLGCKKATIPQNNHDFWKRKLCSNVMRDQQVVAQLKSWGWNVIIIWECSLKHDFKAEMKLVESNLLMSSK